MRDEQIITSAGSKQTKAAGQKQIGIALSGGGIRATIFHLGVLKWMAENNLLENIVRISSVSGASLCIGLIYSHNDHRWPTSSEYMKRVLPRLRDILLKRDIEKLALKKLIVSPWQWDKKVNLLAEILRVYWGISGNIADLKRDPMWYINCTTFETGKRFRFSQENMGDYKIGYVKNPKIPVADAIASSAGFPILIGPYKMNTEKYKWEKSIYSKDDTMSTGKYLHLWDGGVYDNLGLESVFKVDDCGKLSEGVNYLIVSNASGAIEYKKRRSFGFSATNLKRLLDISMNQVTALRNRNVMDYIKRTNGGLYLGIGNSADAIAAASKASPQLREQLIAECLSTAEANQLRAYPTTLSRPSREDFDLLLRHGYEVARCTGLCYHF